MRILPAIQAIFAMALLLTGVVALFGIGITGLLFMVPGAVFAATAAITQEQSRAATAVALAVDGVVAYMAANKLAALLSSRGDIALDPSLRPLGNPSLVEYLVPSAALVLVAIGALAVVMDWRALRRSPWF
jgi:D-arabinose 1-dehydrogenase-like Zn-dependent alcohol dehydrogenase